MHEPLYVSELDDGKNPEVVEFLDGELPQISGLSIEHAKAAHVINKEKVLGIERKEECQKCKARYRTRPKKCKCQQKRPLAHRLKTCYAFHASWYGLEEDFTSCRECERVLNELTPKQKKHEELNSARRALRALENKRVIDAKKEGERRKEHELKEHDAKINAKALVDEMKRQGVVQKTK